MYYPTYSSEHRIFYGVHPHWRGEVHLYADGIFTRPGLHKGTYSLLERQRLQLYWDDWSAEDLSWDLASREYQAPSTTFVMREIPPDAIRTPQRLLVGVLSCTSTAMQERRTNCINSWVPVLESLGVEVLFLVGMGTAINNPRVVPPAEHGRGGVELQLPCEDDHQHLSKKVVGFLKWALANRPFDYLLKSDDDTFLVPHRLTRLNVAGKDYVGYIHTKPVPFANGGAGYLLSRRAAEAVVLQLNAVSYHEDMLVGQAISEAGISAEHDDRFIHDVNYQTRPLPDNELITGHRDWLSFRDWEAIWGPGFTRYW